MLEGAAVAPGNRFRAEKLTATGGELVVGLANSLMWQFAGPDNLQQPHAARFQPGAAAAAGRRAHPRDGAAHDCRAGAAGQRAADGALPPRVLFECGHRRRSGRRAESPRRFLRRQRSGRIQRRRRRRLRPRRRVRRRLRRPGRRLHRRRRRPAGRRLHRPVANRAGHSQSVREHRRRWATAWSNLQAAYDAGRIDRFQVDLARQALYNAQSQLLNSEAIYETTLDNFKLQHGLPPELADQDRRSDARPLQSARSGPGRRCRFA